MIALEDFEIERSGPETALVIQQSKGKWIKQISIVERESEIPSSFLEIKFHDDTGLILYDDNCSGGGSDVRYLHTDDKLHDFTNSVFLGADVGATQKRELVF